MRLRPWKPDLFARAARLLLSSLSVSLASPLHSASEHLHLNNATLTARGWCDGTLCGYYDQVCCNHQERCYTNQHDIATCTPAPTAAPEPREGHWEYFTSTWIETDRITKTKVYSSYVPAPSTPIVVPPPKTTEKPTRCGWGHYACGNVCCKDWQFCVVAGQCSGHRGTFTPPVRPTTIGTKVHTRVVSHTTTVGFQPAIQTGMPQPSGITISESSTSSGLSGGAIAGIVIGVIVGIIILIILCLILCFGAAWNAILDFFGLGRRRRRTVEVEEYRRHGSRTDDRQWYGSSRPSRPPPPKKNRDGWGWGTVILGLGALWAALGFKRRRDRRRRDEKSNYSSSYYSYDSGSSDRRTRDTRRSSRR